MTRVETSGIVGRGRDAEGLDSVIRGLARPANGAPSVRAVGASFKGGA